MRSLENISKSSGWGHGAKSGYSHARWRLKRRFCRFLLGTVGKLLYKLEQVEGLDNIPRNGPAIMMINHIAFADPIITLYVVPRDMVPFAKSEVFNYPIISIFPRIWGTIPVHRGEVDRRALRMALEVLKAGEIVLVAPEGTRNPQLQHGQEGFAYLASRSQALIIPVALWGTNGYPTFPFSSRWRQPGAHVTIGRPFHYRPEFSKPNREQLRKMTDEAMYILAAMLPENLRGVYKDLSEASQDTIIYL